MIAWEHCARCKAMVVGLWALALGLLIFIGWGCSSDTGTKDSGVQADSGVVGQGQGRVDAVDTGTDAKGNEVAADSNLDVGSFEFPGGPGFISDDAGDLRSSHDDGGTGEVGPGDSLGTQSDLGGAETFTPGVDPCGWYQSVGYVACCPDGVDCAPLYGERTYCSCGVQPHSFSLMTRCMAITNSNPKTAKYPTECVMP